MKYESRVIILLEFQEVLLIENAIFFNIITQIHEYHSNRDSLRDLCGVVLCDVFHGLLVAVFCPVRIHSKTSFLTVNRDNSHCNDLILSLKLGMVFLGNLLFTNSMIESNDSSPLYPRISFTQDFPLGDEINLLRFKR